MNNKVIVLSLFFTYLTEMFSQSTLLDLERLSDLKMGGKKAAGGSEKE